ncbi:type VI secretion system Vgr family protein [Photorhabdus noenieputensis]|uniref:type VI secretion system Vgr family protein n=2 Tax=Photorhabdus noenieputensis TaxID=1208607 RepID=UPI002001BCF9|nr:type VI secretion system Vgr family protein [Photorhabdus noenieputensis]MCK3668981.1 type VI secretion system tip protein VgrG [Photorhabdus noenieputensis]
MDRKMLRARQLQAAKAVLPGHARYRLEVRRCGAELDVFSFTGEERLCAPYCYTIDFTSPTRDIDPAVMLNKSATFILQAPENPEQVRKVHGVITRFNRIAASADETRYRVCLEPYLALLRHTRRSGIYQHQSVPEIVEKILRDRHEFRGQDFLFTLVRDYPKRELVVQWQESDLDFIQRILAEVGIWYRFEMDGRLGIEVVRFGDNQRNYQYDVRLPLRDPAGMNHNDRDSVWDLHVEYQVVTQGVKVRDYNYRAAGNDLQYQIRRDRDTTMVGEVYRYGDNFLEQGDQIQPVPETAGFYARLHHERDLYQQHLISGKSSSPMLVPGLVLELDGERPAAVGKAGVLIVAMHSSARRDSNYLVSFSGVPYSEVLSYRPALRERPVIAGTVPARVTSNWPNDTYGHIDVKGRYRVKFDFDLDEWPLGGESLWVRLARPYAGKTHGFHWPLIQGTEVAIAFEQGNPDRPYIAHALHDSRHEDHVTLYNYKRNVLRTPANNKLRMDDERGKEHIKLSTEYGGKSQLNLGHLVDGKRPHPNKRGEGFELRTDDWGAIRAGKGLFISADQQVKASGQQLDMAAVIEQLETALSIAKSLSQAAEIGEGKPGDCAAQTNLNQTLEGLKKPGILMHAPQGIGIVSPESVRVASGNRSVGVIAGKNVDISALKDITAIGGESVNLFAQKSGMQLFAHQGKLAIQAQDDELSALAKKDMAITSIEGKVTLSADREILLSSGGGYIRIKDGNIELGCPGNILLKAANIQKMGAENIHTPAPVPPRGYSGFFTLKDQDSGEILPHRRYRVTTGDGQVFEGISDENGRTVEIHTATPDKLNIEHF